MRNNTFFNVGLIFCLCLVIVNNTSSQTLSLNEMRRAPISPKAQTWLNKESLKPSFVEASIIHVEEPTQYFKSESLELEIGEKTYQLQKLYGKNRTHQSMSWSGVDEEQNAFIFLVNQNKLLAKFYHDANAVTLYPLGKETYALITYDLSKYNSVCGTDGSSITDHNHEGSLSNNAQHYQRAFSSDDECNLRVLVYVTDDAISELAPGMTAADLTQLAVDESNTAYVTSGINFGMEIAAVLSTDYNESNAFSNDSDVGYCVPKDMFDLRNGNGSFSNVPAQRNYYDADVVVLIREDGQISPAGNCVDSINVAGVAYYVPTYNGTAINSDYGFAALEHTGITVGRYTFPHEIGHLQGAKHEDDTRAPNWAIGIINNANAGGRSIMAKAGACNNCRTQSFSGPISTYGSANNDNVRRINETRDTILGHRITPNFLILGNENFENGFKSNHLAKVSLATSNLANITADNGSQVTLRAGNVVELNPGFIAKTGSSIRAYVQGSACEQIPEIDP